MGARNSEIHAMRGKVLNHCAGQDVRRIGVHREILSGCSQVFVVCSLKESSEIRSGFHREVSHVRHEGDANIRAVFKHDRSSTGNIVQASSTNTQKRKSRGEQKESDVILHVPVADFRDDREGRVIYNNGIPVIGHRLIIATRIERAQHLRARQAITINGPILNHRVDILRRVAVISRFLWYEFLNKGLVVGVFVA